MKNKKVFVALAIFFLFLVIFPVSAANKKARLIKAVIIQVDNFTITATKNNNTFTINAERAVLQNAKGERATIDQFFAGDQISAKGSYDSNGIIVARTIKDHSIKQTSLTRRNVGSDNLKDDAISDLNFISNGVITEGKLQAGTLTNASISDSASISASKLNLTNSISGSDLASDINIATTGNITGGTYNGNTITTGTGTLTLNSYILALSGNSQINQNLLTASSPTFAGLTLSSPLSIANGGTGTNNFSSDYLLKGNGVGAVQPSVIYDNGVNVGIGTTLPNAKLDISGGNALNITQGSLSANAQAINLTATWNNAAVLFEPIKFNLTPTAYATESSLFSVYNGTKRLFGMIVGSGPTNLSIKGNDGGHGTIYRARTVGYNASRTNLSEVLLEYVRGTEGNYSYPLGGDWLGAINFDGGVEFLGRQAFVGARTYDNWSAISKPTEIVFATTSNNSTSLAERWKINQIGDLATATDGSGNIGTNSSFGRPSRIYVKNQVLVNQATLVGSNPGVSITGTYNEGSTVFDTITASITNTASATGSSLLRLSANGSDKFVVGLNGNVGVGTTNPAESLDINGQMKLKKNSAEPYACDASHDSAISLTNRYTTCVCKNGSGWVLTADGTTACTWN